MQNGTSSPIVLDLGFFSLFSSFGFEHHHDISYFCVMLNLQDSFDSFIPPPTLFRHLYSLMIFCIFLVLAPSVGCDLARVIFSRKTY
jgi:hypothetical protein